MVKKRTTPRPKKSPVKGRPSLASKVGLILNILIAGLLLASYLSSWVNPGITTIPALLGLAYPYLAAANLLFIIFWLILFKLYFLISLISLALGYQTAARHFQFNTRKPLSELDIQARVMSYNVRMFDFYDWKKDMNSVERILTDISDQAPDILCLQEFYNNPGDDKEMLDLVKDLEKLDYHHVSYDTTRKKHAFGIATFSAFPILEKGEILLSEGPRNTALYSDLNLSGDTVRVYNFHLASYYFGRDDYAFVEGLQKNKDTHNWYRKARQLLGKISKGFRIRAEQARLLKKHIDSSPYPVIVCGDFNETPGSYTYRILSEGLTDAFRASGRGIGKTYAGLLPSYRIDYILLSPGLYPVNFSTHSASVSDHMPITTFIIKDTLNTSHP